MCFLVTESYWKGLTPHSQLQHLERKNRMSPEKFVKLARQFPLFLELAALYWRYTLVDYAIVRVQEIADLDRQYNRFAEKRSWAVGLKILFFLLFTLCMVGALALEAGTSSRLLAGLVWRVFAVLFLVAFCTYVYFDVKLSQIQSRRLSLHEGFNLMVDSIIELVYYVKNNECLQASSYQGSLNQDFQTDLVRDFLCGQSLTPFEVKVGEVLFRCAYERRKLEFQAETDPAARGFLGVEDRGGPIGHPHQWGRRFKRVYELAELLQLNVMSKRAYFEDAEKKLFAEVGRVGSFEI